MNPIAIFLVAYIAYCLIGIFVLMRLARVDGFMIAWRNERRACRSLRYCFPLHLWPLTLRTYYAWRDAVMPVTWRPGR